MCNTSYQRGDVVWSVAGVSPEVNELLMEAQLLQVALPEIQELYRTLLAKPSSVPQADRSSPVRPSSEKVSVQRRWAGRAGGPSASVCAVWGVEVSPSQKGRPTAHRWLPVTRQVLDTTSACSLAPAFQVTLGTSF